MSVGIGLALDEVYFLARPKLHLCVCITGPEETLTLHFDCYCIAEIASQELVGRGVNAGYDLLACSDRRNDRVRTARETVGYTVLLSIIASDFIANWTSSDEDCPISGRVWNSSSALPVS